MKENIMENELKHVGVLGMRWGTRRGQLVRNPTMFSKKRQEKLDEWELGKLKSRKGFRSAHQKRIDEQKIKILEKRVKEVKKKKIVDLKDNVNKAAVVGSVLGVIGTVALWKYSAKAGMSGIPKESSYAAKYAKWLASA